MVKRIRKHLKKVLFLKKAEKKENLHSQKNNFPLNKAQIDRISFSVLRNEENDLRKIENISYEIYINEKWEWVVRYDDHGGAGNLHRHVRISLNDQRDVESVAGIKKYKNKNDELTWICKNIKKNYLRLRKRVLKNMGLDLY